MILKHKKRSKQALCRPRWHCAGTVTGWQIIGPWLRRYTVAVRILIALALPSFLLGCDKQFDRASAEATCREIGLCPEEVHLRRYALLCDTSLLAPCDASTLAASLDVVLPAASRDGGCPVEVWMLGGTSIGDLRSLGEKISPTLPEARDKVREGTRERWRGETRAFYLRAAEPFFKVHPRRSVLAEGITKIMMAHPPDPQLPMDLIIVSDAREVSIVGGDLECDTPPAPSIWTAKLQRRGILAPGTLANTRVYWTYVQLGSAAPRCRASVQQEQLVRGVWSHVLSAAGAERVAFLSGPVVLGGDSSPVALARKE